MISTYYYDCKNCCRESEVSFDNNASSRIEDGFIYFNNICKKCFDHNKNNKPTKFSEVADDMVDFIETVRYNSSNLDDYKKFTPQTLLSLIKIYCSIYDESYYYTVAGKVCERYKLYV